MSNNNNNNSGLLGLALGLMAGGLAGYYLASEDGQKMRKKAKKEFAKMEKQARQSLKEQSEVLSQKLNEAAASTKTFVADTAATTKTFVNDTADTARVKLASFKNTTDEVVDDVESDFQRGINNAKAKMNAKANKISKVAENGVA